MSEPRIDFLTGEVDRSDRHSVALTTRGQVALTVCGATASLLTALLAVNTRLARPYEIDCVESYLFVALISIGVAAVILLFVVWPATVGRVDAEDMRSFYEDPEVPSKQDQEREIVLALLDLYEISECSNQWRSGMVTAALCLLLLAILLIVYSGLLLL